MVERSILIVGAAPRVAVLLSALLAGCASTEPEPRVIVDVVEVPAPYREPFPDPPPELLEHYTGPLPVFVAPSHPDAEMALDAEGAQRLRELIRRLKNRGDSWAEWVRLQTAGGNP